MCCFGCQAVAQAIIDNQLDDYYKYRSNFSVKGQALVPDELKQNALLDQPNLQDEFVYQTSAGKEAILSIDGITCSACAWLIEKQICKLPGVERIDVNATTQRATLGWHEDQVKLSEILGAIAAIGYHASPFKAIDAEQQSEQQKKSFVRRLGISGILMMQVLMISFALYFGAFSDISEHNLLYLRWTSMLLTVPIIAYGALPFYQGALSALKSRHLTMDVPVAIAIILAFAASIWATLKQTGEVYFESIAMFTFLLLTGKFLEFRARSRAAQMSANLLKLMPLTATKLDDQQETPIAAKHLLKGDQVLIKPGETVPADGFIISGKSSINEAMLSGEQSPVSKQVNSPLYAGTINGDGNLIVEVSAPSKESFLSGLIRLSEQAQNHKPQIALLSDKIAQYFVALILFTACCTAIYWHWYAPEKAFWITISVLVATCPCALSLATPTALTCTTTYLNKLGIMIKSGHVLETLPQINSFAFDKTGTLTSGEFSITRFINTSNHYSDECLLALATALERHSQHPIARAFKQDNHIQLSSIEVVPSAGVLGYWNEQKCQVAIGKSAWLAPDDMQQYQDCQCLLTIDGKICALFYLNDQIRPDTSTLINQLHQQNIQTLLLSGDNQAGVDKLSRQITLDKVLAGLTPQQKLAELKALQKQGKRVAMVGDGVNDTPVFGAAHISISMGSGTDIAKNGADVILLNNRLTSIYSLYQAALKNKQIIRQNYLWAFGYNAIILPLAVCGFVTPYLAVLGMSASSLVVISNSLRLLKK
jgi:Cu2+-exporting ATPase